MPHVKLTTLQNHTHIVALRWDGFVLNPNEKDGDKILGNADLPPDEAHNRRGTWRITVEFEPEQRTDSNSAK